MSRRSVLENLDRDRKYRPNAVKSVQTTEVNSPIQTDLAWLIRCLLYGKEEN